MRSLHSLWLAFWNILLAQRRSTRRVDDDSSPTSNALIRIQFTDGKAIASVAPSQNHAQENSESTPEATPCAHASFRYKEADAQITVPPKQASHLLRLTAFLGGVGGIVISCYELSQGSFGPPTVRDALCGLCAIIIFWLARTVILKDRD